LSYPANRQTDRHRWKHKLLGRVDNAILCSYFTC